MKHPSHVPPEWAPQRAIWTAWPHLAEEWPEPLARPRTEIAALIRALAVGQKVHVLVKKGEAQQTAEAVLKDAPNVALLPFTYGDIWLRDTAPVFSRRADGTPQAEIFRFNCWGEKFDLPDDRSLAERLAAQTDALPRPHPFILEGGSVDVDGTGYALTTAQCLMNPNRNKGWTRATAEAALHNAYGVDHVVWIDDGLLNDHTDGHIDNIARFVGPAHVVCQSPNGADDPNAATLRAIERQLRAIPAFTVTTIPSPGLVKDTEGTIVPASHMNFIIGNDVVVVPVYNEKGAEAVAALAPLFPTRKVIGLSSVALLGGGGSFHCITQQEPA